MQDSELTEKKSKKTRKPKERIVYHVNAGHLNDHLTPLHAQSAGYTENVNQAKPDECKGHALEAMLAQNGVATFDPVAKGAAEWAAASEKPMGTRVADYSAQRDRRNGFRVAVGSLDLDGQGGSVSARLAHLRSENLRTARGDNNFNKPMDDQLSPGGYSEVGRASVSLYDAASETGRYRGMQGVDFTAQRPAAHQHRDSGTPSNGTHSLNDVESHAVANKASDRLRLMKETMRVIT